MTEYGRCFDCGRTVAVIDGHDVLRARLQRHGNGTGTPCPGSGCGFGREREPVVAAARHGDGAKGIAPCGHEGTYVTARMVLCDKGWCPGTPSRLAPPPAPLYECRHAVRITFNGTTSCKDCGRVFVRGKP